MTITLKKASAYTSNQVSVLKALDTFDGFVSGGDIQRHGFVKVTIASVYGILARLEEDGLVKRKQTHVGAGAKGNRYAFQILAKGRRYLEKNS